MRKLADATGETVHLSIIDGIDVVYIEKIDSPQPIRAYSMVGGRAPAYAVATGKALLAHQIDGYVERYGDKIVRHTPATVTSLPLLKEELRKIVRVGYAINNGEWRAGVGGLAVTIFNLLDQPVAAVGISGPLERLTAKTMREFAPSVIECARDISRQLGHQDTYAKQ
jgi:DNA-binding IclR family transcriptional regulator